MFELTKEEFENLMSKKSTSSWGGRRKLLKVFTEQGIYITENYDTINRDKFQEEFRIFSLFSAQKRRGKGGRQIFGFFTAVTLFDQFGQTFHAMTDHRGHIAHVIQAHRFNQGLRVVHSVSHVCQHIDGNIFYYFSRR